jgi:hypothetical protein
MGVQLNSVTTRSTEQRLVDEIGGFAHDPLGFVEFAFPWGEPGTELAGATGPRAWQAGLLHALGQRLREGRQLGLMLPILMARASGHGVGKSTVAAWVLHWGLSTMPDARVVVTANTDTQLRTKTWPEVTRWLRLAINSHWFRATATAVYSVDPAHERLWRADAIPWSEENTEAFAGLHNKGRRAILLFDEASAIADKIWEVSEGALTDEDTEIIWLAFGNPTRNTGRLRECFGRFRHRWDYGADHAGKDGERPLACHVADLLDHRPRRIDADEIPAPAIFLPARDMAERAAEEGISDFHNTVRESDFPAGALRRDHADPDDGSIALIERDAGGMKCGDPGIGSNMATACLHRDGGQVPVAFIFHPVEGAV